MLRCNPAAKAGSVLVLLMIMLPVLFILASYAINIAYVEAVRGEVQIATDAAVQAAGRAYIQTEDRDAALLAARDAVNRNPVSGVVIPVNAVDLEFGISQRTSMSSAYDFVPIAADQTGNAVRLTTRSLHDAASPVLSPLFPTLGSSFEIRPTHVAVSTQGTMDIALVIDRSGSMAFASDELPDPYNNPAAAPVGWVFGDPVPPNSRWLDLVASVNSFTSYLTDSPQYEKVSLSTYSDTTATNEMLTFHYADVSHDLNAISQAFPGGGTAIGMGLQEGIAALTDPTRARPYAVKVMVLMTDGIHNTGVSPESVMSTLQNQGITLFTITFSDDADQARMKDLAIAGGGSHFHAANAAQLMDAFKKISRKLPSLMTL